MKRGREGEGDDSVLNTLAYANARASEIRALSQEVADKADKRIMQQLPHHRQRRQMTFTARRMPRPVRPAAERELASFNVAPKLPKHRAFRRRPGYLLRNFGARQKEGHQWLQTHQWHAKRFVMIRLFGLMLPKTPTDRGTRSAGRSMLRQCVIHDNSVERPLVLSCVSTASLMAGLSRVGEGWLRGPLRRGGCAGQVLLHTAEKEAVAPVTFVWRREEETPNARGELMMWVHISALTEVKELLASVLPADATMREPDLVLFDLMGPESHSVARRVCAAMAGDSRWGRIAGGVDSQTQLPEHMAVFATLNDPRLTMAAAALFSPSSSVSSAAALSAAQLQAWSNAGEAGAWSHLWDGDAPMPSKQTDLDTRRIKKAKPAAAGVQALLIQRPGEQRGPHGLGSGYSLVIPAAWARPFWNAFQLANARSVGLEDVLRMRHQELGQAVFPFDYPDTAAGRSFALHNAALLMGLHLRRPPAKRVNFLRIDPLSFPFLAPRVGVIHRGPLTEAIADDAMVEVRVSMAVRGTMRFNAALLQPTEEDLHLAKDTSPAQHRCDKRAADATLEELWQQTAAAYRQPYAGALPVGAGNRPQVGFAFGGGISMKRGQGHGVACVTAAFLRSSPGRVAMVRNPNSRDVFRAIMHTK